MSKKKVLYIHHGKGLGGAPLSLLYLIEGLDKTKFEPVVLFLHDSEAVELYRSKGINVVGIVGLEDFSHTKVYWFRWYHFHHLLKSLWHSFKTSVFVANKWIKKINPDLIHLNTSSLTAWAKVAKKNNIPVVFHVREPLARGYFGIRRKIVTKMVQKYSDVIIPISNNDSKPWNRKKRLMLNRSKVFVIYNPVDSNKFNKDISGEDFLTKYKISKYDPKVLFLGGLSKEKGTLVILKVFEKLLRLLPGSKLILAGYFDLNIEPIYSLKRYFPSQRYNLKVQRILNRLGQSVILTGAIKDVESALSSCDVLVNPFTVGHFARPIIEAGFMAKPVVASKIAPLDEIMIHGITGYLIDNKALGTWVEKLYALLTNKKLNEKMGQKAYDFCHANFRSSYHALKVMSVYENLLDI